MKTKETNANNRADLSPEGIARRKSRRAVYFAAHGDISRAAGAIISKGVAPLDADIVEKLEKMHPHEDEYIAPESYAVKLHTIGKDLVTDCIQSWKITAGSGPARMKPAFILNVMNCPRWYTLLTEITRFVNFVLAGKVPLAIRPFFASANITPLWKDIQRRKIRPVANGILWRKLVEKVAARALQTKVGDLMAPHFLGIGVRGATEIAAHTIRKLKETRNELHGKCFAKIDLSNAFNDNLRSWARKAIARYVPELLPIFDTAYAQHSYLYANGLIFKSKKGQQQGASLASMFFNFALYLFRMERSAIYEGLDFDFGYHDDICVIGTPAAVAKFLTDASAILLSDMGMTLNTNKTHIYFDPSHTQIGAHFFECEGIQFHEDFNIDFVGSPVGDQQFTDTWLGEHVLAGLETFLECLLDVDDSHTQFILLKYSASFCKGVHIIRTTPPALVDDFTTKYDNLCRSSFESITARCGMDNNAFAQASLGIKGSGIGLRPLNHHCLAAYVSSWNASQATVKSLVASYLSTEDTSEIDCSNENKIKTDFLATIDFDDKLEITQRNLSLAIDRKAAKDLIVNAPNIICTARLLAQRSTHAYEWLNALPTPGNRFRTKQYSVALCLWLGMPILSIPMKCPLCSMMMDTRGHHALVCKNGGMTTRRHNAVRNIIHDWARRAHWNPVREKKHLFPDSSEKAADVFFPTWKEGCPAAVDVAVVSPLQAKYLKSSVAEIFDDYGDLKRKRYRSKCIDAGITFIPFIVLSLGGFNKGAMTVISRLAQDLHRQNPIPRRNWKKLITQSITCSIMRSNATSVLERIIGEDWAANYHWTPDNNI